jgi:hypothetical protein
MYRIKNNIICKNLNVVKDVNVSNKWHQWYRYVKNFFGLRCIEKKIKLNVYLASENNSNILAPILGQYGIKPLDFILKLKDNLLKSLIFSFILLIGKNNVYTISFKQFNNAFLYNVFLQRKKGVFLNVLFMYKIQSVWGNKKKILFYLLKRLFIIGLFFSLFGNLGNKNNTVKLALKIIRTIFWCEESFVSKIIRFKESFNWTIDLRFRPGSFMNKATKCVYVVAAVIITLLGIIKFYHYYFAIEYIFKDTWVSIILLSLYILNRLKHPGYHKAWYKLLCRYPIFKKIMLFLNRCYKKYPDVFYCIRIACTIYAACYLVYEIWKIYSSFKYMQRPAHIWKWNAFIWDRGKVYTRKKNPNIFEWYISMFAETIENLTEKMRQWGRSTGGMDAKEQEEEVRRWYWRIQDLKAKILKYKKLCKDIKDILKEAINELISGKK